MVVILLLAAVSLGLGLFFAERPGVNTVPEVRCDERESPACRRAEMVLEMTRELAQLRDGLAHIEKEIPAEPRRTKEEAK